MPQWPSRLYLSGKARSQDVIHYFNDNKLVKHKDLVTGMIHTKKLSP
jgi:hypothetical protein